MNRILDIKNDTEMDFNVFLSSIKDKDIIYFGEFHQIPEVLAFQKDLVSGFLHKGVKPSIGLEMFNVLQQEMLNYYIADAIPFDQLLSLYETGPEGFDLNHYIGLIDMAAENSLKVICLNIPRNIASEVSKSGLDMRQLKGFHLSEDNIKNCSSKYRAEISGIYRKHPHSGITEENFILAQFVKDEMMAETVVYYLPDDSSRLRVATTGMPLIVISGRGHIERGLGIPERVRWKFNSKGRSVSDCLVIAAYEDEQIEKGIADYAVLI